MSRGTRRELLTRLRREGHLTDDEYRTLAGAGLSWAGALYYIGGGLLLIGTAALAAEFWSIGSVVAHLVLALVLSGLLFLGALLLRQRGNSTPGMILLLGSLLASQLIAVSVVQAVGPPLTAASQLSLSPTGGLVASGLVLLAAAGCVMFWSAPVVSAAVIVVLAIFVSNVATLACGSDFGCPTVPASLLGLGLALVALGMWHDRGVSGEEDSGGHDHAFWFSILGLIIADVSLAQLFSWDTAAGALFLVLQAAALTLSVRVGRYLLGVLTAMGAVIYLEAQLVRVFSGSPLAGPLAAVALGAAAIYLGILARRRAGRGQAPLRGSIWL